MDPKERKKSSRKSKKSSGIRKGRFKAGMDPLFEKFNSSISFDRRLFREDIRGSIAHVKMLGRQGIIPHNEARTIEEGLKQVLADIAGGKVQLRDDLEDIHVNIEEALKSKVGEVAGKLHTARSRNDQVVLDLRLYVKAQVDLVREALLKLMKSLVDKASEEIDLIMPGYTHLQRAQPVRPAHHLMAYSEMARRDWERFTDAVDRLDQMPLGSAALAGTTFPIDRESVATDLGFSTVSANSMDAVSDRDFVVEFLFNCAMVMMHLSRLAEELILWSTEEFGFCTLPDEFCSGSSIMPQKKNPDACELIRGKTGRVYGDLTALLTTMKGLPLAYNKDLQEDKEPLFDAVDTVLGSVGIMGELIPGIRFHKESMLTAASDQALAATDLADSLARQGVPFREAHSRIGAIIRGSGAESGKGVEKETLPGPEDMVEARSHKGGTARKAVKEHIRATRRFLAAKRK